MHLVQTVRGSVRLPGSVSSRDPQLRTRSDLRRFPRDMITVVVKRVKAERRCGLDASGWCVSHIR